MSPATSPVRRFVSSPLPPHERGLEYGERLAADVARTCSAYRRLFVRRADRPFDVDDWSERAWDTIQRLDPTAADEIAGIAAGARVPVRDVAAVNARTELLAAGNPSGIYGVSECSSVVAFPPAGPVVVQTWDWYDVMADNWLHWTIPHPDGRHVETVTEFGMLGKIGVNQAGVGVLLNMLHHASDEAAADGAMGYPVHLLARRILDEAMSFDDAVTLATRGPRSASTSLTVVAGEQAASVELFPAGYGLLRPDADGVMVRTNHFVSDEGAPGCTAHLISESTRIRRDTLLTRFAGRPPSSAAEVLAAMADHGDDDGFGGVCVHPDTRVDPLLWHATLATVVLDLPGRSLGVTAGGPCGRHAGHQHPEPALATS